MFQTAFKFSFFCLRFACVPLASNARLLAFVVKADNDFILSVLYNCFHWYFLRLLKVIK